MSERRAVVDVAKAINALPQKPRLTAFLLVEDNGRPKRLLDTYRREEIINMIEHLGGVDVSGDDFLRLGFGLAFPIETRRGHLWFFIETKPDFCPFCQGVKTVRNEVDYEIISETCWVCDGIGHVLTQPVPQRPGKLELLV